jgi:hypothetical protein
MTKTNIWVSTITRGARSHCSRKISYIQEVGNYVDIFSTLLCLQSVSPSFLPRKMKHKIISKNDSLMYRIFGSSVKQTKM